MTNYTLRFPRRMSDINPYMSGPVEPMAEPHHPHDKLVMVGSVIAGLAVLAMHFAGWLPGAGA